MKKLSFVTIAGRHETPAKSAIIDEVEDVLDFDGIQEQVKQWVDTLPKTKVTRSIENGPCTLKSVATILEADVEIYVTGLTAVTVAVVTELMNQLVTTEVGGKVSLLHYDAVNKTYKAQEIPLPKFE
jgi:hypothetical protein